MKQHLRHDKTCLNCGATVGEQYCTRCGQENVETKESFSHLLRHFFADVTHYDSKFFITIKALLFKPGLLTEEYIAGTRATYLHPIRTYLFISFLYFLITITFEHTGQGVEERGAQNARKQIADSLDAILAVPPANGFDTIRLSVIKDLKSNLRLNSGLANDFNVKVIGNIDYKELHRYDSLQRLLPEAKKDKGLKPWLYHRWLTTINRDGEATIPILAEWLRHIIPKMMFIFLPLFALLLKLFYRGKKSFYADHAIFSLHFHSAVFLMFLIFACLSLMMHALSPYFSMVELVLAFVYLVLAVRRTYQQSVGVSILKTIALTILYSVFIAVGFVVVALSALL